VIPEVPKNDGFTLEAVVEFVTINHIVGPATDEIEDRHERINREQPHPTPNVIGILVEVRRPPQEPIPRLHPMGKERELPLFIGDLHGNLQDLRGKKYSLFINKLLFTNSEYFYVIKKLF